MKIRNLEILVITSHKIDTPWEERYQYPFKQVFDAGKLVKNRIDFDTAKVTNISISDFERLNTLNVLKIKRTPTILFIDKDNETALTRLDSTIISMDDVASTIASLDTLTKDGKGKYWRKDGQPFFPVAVRFNYLCKTFGICTKPPKWLSGALGVISAYKAVQAKSKVARIGYGAVSVASWYSYFR